MQHRALTFGFVAAMLLVRAQAAHAGATTIPEFRLGSCGASQGAPACDWDCDVELNNSPPFCQNAQSCQLDVTEAFNAHLIVRADDAPCGSAGGAVLEFALHGTKADQSEFTVPSRSINLCGVNNACGSCDLDECTETDQSCPLDVIFHCELTGPNQFGPELCPNNQLGERRFCETDLKDLVGWLLAGKQPILAEMATDLAAQFPAATGPPVVIGGAFELVPLVDNSADLGQPSIGRYCLDIGFLRDPKPVLLIPPEVALAPRTASSLVVKGGCLCGNNALDIGEECDDGNIADGDGCDGGCKTETSGCPASPDPSCLSSFGGCLLVANEKATGKEKLVAKWLKGPAFSAVDLGNPLNSGGSAYDVCVYDGSGGLAGSYRVDRAGATCGADPCWKNIGKPPGDPKHKGYEYKDKAASADGVLLVLLKGGEAGASKAVAKGMNNSAKGQTALPTGLAAALNGSTSATIQLHGSDAIACLSCPLSTVLKDTGALFKAK